MPTSLTIPDDFLSGGKGLTPNLSAGEPDVKSLLEAAIETGPTAKFQAGTGTLVAGTFTVNTGIALTADSKILLTLNGTVGTTTNFAGLAVTTRTTGDPGTAEFTVEAILATGLIDSDAVGDVDWLIID